MAHSDRGTFGHHSYAVVSTLTRIAGSTIGERVSASPSVGPGTLAAGAGVKPPGAATKGARVE